MGGLPLTNGFLSKEMFLTEAVDAQALFAYGWMVPLAAVFGSVFSFAYSLRLVHDVFFGSASAKLPNPEPHEPPLAMRAPPTLLAIVCIVVGLAPAVTFGPLVQLAASAMLGAPPPEYHLQIWHGFNLPLLLSAVAIVGGSLMYWLLHRHYQLHLHHPRGWTARLLFTHAIDWLFGFAGRVIQVVENGSLQRYAAWLIGSAIVLAAGRAAGRPGRRSGWRHRASHGRRRRWPRSSGCCCWRPARRWCWATATASGPSC